MTIRAILDANVLVSGLISKKGVPGQLLDGWRTGLYQIVISSSILMEPAFSNIPASAPVWMNKKFVTC
jgi:predicted nucleic acid-binding protein